MRVVRLMLTGVLAWIAAVGLTVTPQARQMADEDYDKLMKSVGQTNGSMRKNLTADMTDAASADAKKLAELFKNAAAFWTARKTTDAAEWATAAMNHALEVDKAIAAKNAAGAGEHAKMLAGTCATCHAKYRDKGADGTFIIKKQ